MYETSTESAVFRIHCPNSCHNFLVHQMKKRGIVPNTLFMEQLMEQSERSQRNEKDKRKGKTVDSFS